MAVKLFTVEEGDYILMPWGMCRFMNNELHLVTSVNDPSGISFIGGDGCKLSYKDAQGNERTLLQLRRNKLNDGEYYFGAIDQTVLDKTGNLDFAMKEVLTINPDGAEFRVPVKFSAGASVDLPAPSAAASEVFPNKLVSPDGHLELDIQNADAPGCVLYQDGVAIGRLLTMKEIAKLARYIQ